MNDLIPEMNTKGIRELLRDVAESACDAVICAGSDGIIKLMNREAREIFGYSKAEIIGEPITRLVPDHMIENHTIGFTRWAQSNTLNAAINRRVVPAVRKDGSAVSIELSFSNLPLNGRDYVVAFFQDMSADVTETARLKKRLRKTLDRYRRLFESSPLALWEEDYSAVKIYIDELLTSGVCDLRAYFDEHPEALYSCAAMIRIVDVNKAAVEMAGAASKEALLGELTNVLTSSSFVQLKEQLVWLAAGNLSYSTEVENTMPSGERLSIDLKLSISPEFSSCWSEVIVSLVDITERKLREKQLAHSMKMDAIGRLTGGIAHDFNNVLTVISGNLRLISDMSGHEMGAETKEMFEDVLSAADDGAELTSRLLAFSSKPTSQADQLGVEAIILDFAELMKRTLGSDINIDADISDDLLDLELDKNEFGNILINLSMNARDAMVEGGTLTFRASNGMVENDAVSGQLQVSGPGPCVVVEVIDTGIGMSEEVIANATEPFFTTKAVDEGNGLGLSMVREFVNGCGGLLKIDSVVGSGTTISLYLPLQSGASDQATKSLY